MVQALDPDDVATWSDDVVALLNEHARDLAPDYEASDLHVPVDDSDVIAAMHGAPLRAYHCTRLLPSEVEAVLRDGLRALSQQHTDARIWSARDAGVLSTDEAARLVAGSVYAMRSEWPDDSLDGRTGAVYGVLGLRPFATQAHGLDRLLTLWGGEATYWHADAPLMARLRSIGTPSIVVLDLDLADDTRTRVGWSLANLLVGHLAGLDERGGSFRRDGSIPGGAVVGLWHPGSTEYDRFPDLPQG